MNHIHSAIPKFFWKIMPVLAIAIWLVTVTSCGESKTAGDRGCFTLTREQIQTEWIDKGFIGNSNPRENISAVEIFTVPSGSTFTISVQGQNEFGEPKGDRISLGTGTGCPSSFPRVTIRRNFSDIAGWNILNGNRLADGFQNMSFTPAEFVLGSERLLQLDISSYFEGSLGLETPDALPCPPCVNCRPRCPSWCTPPCPPTTLDTGAYRTLDTGAMKSLDTAAKNKQ